MKFFVKVVAAGVAVVVAGAIVLLGLGRGSEREVRRVLQDAAAAWNRQDEARVLAHLSPRMQNRQAVEAELRALLAARTLTDARIEDARITVMGDTAQVEVQISAQVEVRRIRLRLRLTLERSAGDPAWVVVDGEQVERSGG